MRITPIAALALGALVVGCGRSTVPAATEGSRAQKFEFEMPSGMNDFVGLWVSPPNDTVNNWIVVFTPSGLVAVDGPGLKADGTYKAEGHLARSAFSTRNGKETAEERPTLFQLTPDGKTLLFRTGDPMDPPVSLVRSDSGTQPLGKREIRQSIDSAGAPDPFTLT